MAIWQRAFPECFALHYRAASRFQFASQEWKRTGAVKHGIRSNQRREWRRSNFTYAAV
jgi:hypothetical protein